MKNENSNLVYISNHELNHELNHESNYKKLSPIYVGDRGWSLSKHPGNHGKFSLQGLSNSEFKSINNWVDKQQQYIQNLSLDTRAAILLWQCYSRAYDEDLNPTSLLTEDDEKLRELFELIPPKDVIHRYKYLVQNAILNAPSLPLPVIAYTRLYPGVGVRVNNATKFPSFIQASFVQTSFNQKYENSDIILIKLDIGMKFLYLDAGFGNGNEILLPMGTCLYINSIQTLNKESDKRNIIISSPIFKSHVMIYYLINDIKDNDTIFYENAKKETLEETSIDISNTGKIVKYDGLSSI